MAGRTTPHRQGEGKASDTNTGSLEVGSTSMTAARRSLRRRRRFTRRNHAAISAVPPSHTGVAYFVASSARVGRLA